MVGARIYLLYQEGERGGQDTQKRKNRGSALTASSVVQDRFC